MLIACAIEPIPLHKAYPLKHTQFELKDWQASRYFSDERKHYSHAEIERRMLQPPQPMAAAPSEDRDPNPALQANEGGLTRTSASTDPLPYPSVFANSSCGRHDEISAPPGENPAPSIILRVVLRPHCASLLREFHDSSAQGMRRSALCPAQG